MVDHKSDLTFLGMYPKCPFYRPVRLLIILAMIVVGSWVISFLNTWVSVSYSVYSVLLFFLVLPLTICKSCYYKTRETAQTCERLLSVDKWREMHLKKWVSQGEKVRIFMGIIWLLPMVLIFISFFFNFSLFALLSLIGCIAVLGGNVLYMNQKVCPTCAINDECHSSFES